MTDTGYGPEPFDFDEPEAVRLRKAGERAFWYALRNAGWTDEQIRNGLRTHYEAIASELSDKIVKDQNQRLIDGEPYWETQAGMNRAACLINPKVIDD